MNKKIATSIFLALSILTLSGCVYYHLLKLKWQMEKFEDNFNLEDKKGLTIIFKNPVLTKEDIKWLMNNGPTSIVDDPLKQNSWLYILTKKKNPDVTEEKNYDIDIQMGFNHDMLVEATLPKRFLENLSKEMLVEIFKSMGKSKVDKKKKQAGSVMKGKNKGIPTINDVLYTLGEPHEKKEENEIIELRYIYNLKSPENNSILNPFDLIFDFKINKKDKYIRTSSIDVNGLKMTMKFELQ